MRLRHDGVVAGGCGHLRRGSTDQVDTRYEGPDQEQDQSPETKGSEGGARVALERPQRADHQQHGAGEAQPCQPPLDTPLFRITNAAPAKNTAAPKPNTVNMATPRADSTSSVPSDACSAVRLKTTFMAPPTPPNATAVTAPANENRDHIPASCRSTRASTPLMPDANARKTPRFATLPRSRSGTRSSRCR